MKKKQHGKLYLFMGVLLVIVAVLGIFFKWVQPENEAHKETVRLAKKYAHLKEDAFYRYSSSIRLFIPFSERMRTIKKFTPLFRKTAKKSTSTVKKTASLLKQPKKQSENGSDVKIDYQCRNGYEGKNSRLGSYLSERLRQFVL